MATGVGSWSTTAGDNANASSNINFAEGQAPSTLNNSMRALMAEVAALERDEGWIQLQDHSHTYASATSTTVAGVNVTARYPVGRRVRAVGSSTGTIYGTVSAVSFSTDTTVTYKWDSTGALSNEALAISVSRVGPKGQGGNFSGAVNTAKAVAIASATACDIWAANGNVLHITGTTAIENFGTAPQAGCIRFCIADGALPITRNGTTIETQSGASITFAAGEAFLAVADTTTKTFVYPFQAASPTYVPNRQIFTASGTFSKSSITNGATHILVKCWGGGGGGSGGNSGHPSRGVGGGGGGYCEERIAVSALASSEDVTIGAGGNGGTDGNAGSNGGNTTFGTSPFLTAGGGTGGSAAQNNAQAGVAGGSGSGGDLNLTGGSSGLKSSTTQFMSPGGNGAGGGGQGGAANVGDNGQVPGGGGAGGNHQGTVTGGAGAAGLCFVEW